MLNDVCFLVRMSERDKVMLKELATRLQRSQADTVRVVLREKLVVLREQDPQRRDRNQAEYQPAN